MGSADPTSATMARSTSKVDARLPYNSFTLENPMRHSRHSADAPHVKTALKVIWTINACLFALCVLFYGPVLFH